MIPINTPQLYGQHCQNESLNCPTCLWPPSAISSPPGFAAFLQELVQLCASSVVRPCISPVNFRFKVNSGSVGWLALHDKSEIFMPTGRQVSQGSSPKHQRERELRKVKSGNFSTRKGRRSAHEEWNGWKNLHKLCRIKKWGFHVAVLVCVCAVLTASPIWIMKFARYSPGVDTCRQTGHQGGVPAVRLTTWAGAREWN